MAVTSPYYGGALVDYSKMVYQPYKKMMQQITPSLGRMMGYYAPGGGYGAGLREEAAEQVRGGLGRDVGTMIASGMSGQFGARGAATRAGGELSRLYKNIEDTRAALWQQSIQPYAQIMSQMANIFAAKPTLRQYGAGESFIPLRPSSVPVQSYF